MPPTREAVDLISKGQLLSFLFLALYEVFLIFWLPLAYWAARRNLFSWCMTPPLLHPLPFTFSFSFSLSFLSFFFPFFFFFLLLSSYQEELTSLGSKGIAISVINCMWLGNLRISWMWKYSKAHNLDNSGLCWPHPLGKAWETWVKKLASSCLAHVHSMLTCVESVSFGLPDTELFEVSL